MEQRGGVTDAPETGRPLGALSVSFRLFRTWTKNRLLKDETGSLLW